jgi:hypothetical protein
MLQNRLEDIRALVGQAVDGNADELEDHTISSDDESSTY